MDALLRLISGTALRSVVYKAMRGRGLVVTIIVAVVAAVVYVIA